MTSFWRNSEPETQVDNTTEKIETWIDLTRLGQKVEPLMRAYQSIDTDSEIIKILSLLEQEEIDSQSVRTRLAPLRDQLQAKIALLQALFAILPADRQHGYTGYSEKLSERKSKTISS